MRRGRQWLGGLALALYASGAGQAFATKLDKDSCKALKAEVESLVAAGVKTDMERGSEWAQANLAPARLSEIKHLIELGEQLEFRCGSAGTDGARLARSPDLDDGKGADGRKAKRHKPGAASQKGDQKSDAMADPAEPAPGASEGSASKGGMPVNTITSTEAEAKAARAIDAADEDVAREGDSDEDVAPSLGAAGAAASQAAGSHRAPAASRETHAHENRAPAALTPAAQKAAATEQAAPHLGPTPAASAASGKSAPQGHGYGQAPTNPNASSAMGVPMGPPAPVQSAERPAVTASTGPAKGSMGKSGSELMEPIMRVGAGGVGASMGPPVPAALKIPAAAPVTLPDAKPAQQTEASHRQAAAQDLPDDPAASAPSLGAAGAAAAGPGAPQAPKPAPGGEVPSLGKAASSAAPATSLKAAKKGQRGRTNSAYVAPSDVNSSFVPTYGGSR